MRRARPVLEDVRGRIDKILEEWSTRTTGKQRITGTLVHAQLRREGSQVVHWPTLAAVSAARVGRLPVWGAASWAKGTA